MLVANRLVDYIALDYKAPKEKYHTITRDKHFDRFSETLNFLIDSRFSFEVRTTVHSDLLRAEEINRIIRDLVRRGYTGTYYLQRFVYTEHTIGRIKPERNAFDAALLEEEIRVVWRT